MSALSNTAPRFRSPAPAQLPATVPHGFAQTLDVPPRLASSLATPLSTPLATPLAPPPPPPLHLSSTQPRQRNALRYAGVDHTLGPTFSEEEDGDDSDFIAAKMAALGLDPRAGGQYVRQQKAYAQQQVQGVDLQQRQAQQLLQLHALKQQQQLQQQAAALQTLALQATDPQQIREAMALLELQRAQMAATTPSAHLERLYAQQVALQQRAAIINNTSYQRQIQQQQLLQLQNQYAAAGQRQALAAQLEAGTLRREREREREQRERMRPMSPDDVRAAFESAPSSYFPPISPRIDSAAGVGWTSSGKTAPAEWPMGWNLSSAPGRTQSTGSNAARAPSPVGSATATTPTTPVPLGRFARARQDLAAAQAAAPGATPLAALLSRRRHTDEDSVSALSDTAATSPHSPMHPERKWSYASDRKVLSESDHVTVHEPTSYNDWGYHAPAPRSASFSTSRDDVGVRGSFVVRQPFGPPGSVDELGQKNFATSIRRKAGLNLGMLNRRSESAEA